MTTQIAGIIDDQYRDRLRSLLSVDDLVEEVINTLKVNANSINCTFVKK